MSTIISEDTIKSTQKMRRKTRVSVLLQIKLLLNLLSTSIKSRGS